METRAGEGAQAEDDKQYEMDPKADLYFPNSARRKAKAEEDNVVFS